MKTSGAKRIAERYVKALFEVAQGVSALNAVEQDMHSMEQALAGSEEFRHFLNNPLLTRETQADSMAAILAKMKAHEVTRKFIAMLTQQKRMPILPEIASMFVEWAQRARGEMSAELIAAGPLKPEESAQVSQRLAKAFGKKVNLELKQDPSLLGGVVVKIGSQQLDASLAGKIARLKIALQAA